ncbi:MAG: hypothetical protein AB7T63_17605 [Planctomycetota bacterium]
MRFSKTLPVIASLAVVLGLAACGDAPAPGMRIAIHTLPDDGEPPQPLWLSPLDKPAGSYRIPLRATGREGDVYHYVADAPAGAYRVENSAGWGTLTSGQSLQVFHTQAEGPPNVVWLARSGTLYMRPRTADTWRVLPVVALERRTSPHADTYERVPVEVTVQPGGWLVVRLPDAVLVPGTQLRAFSLFEGHVATRPVELPIPDNPAVPYVRLLDPAASPPLVVEVVGGPIDDGVEAELRLVAHPLDLTWTAPFQRGRAWFSGIGEHGDGVVVSLPAWGDEARWRVDGEAWQEEQALFPLALDAEAKPRRVRLPALAADVAPRRILLRATTADRLGQVPLDRDDDGGWSFVVPAGEHVGWIEADGTFAPITVRAETASDADAITVGAFAPAATIVGSVVDTRDTVRVRAERETGAGTWIGGASRDVMPDPGLGFTLRVPPGRWRLCVVRSDLRTSEPRTVPVSLEPGTRFTGFDLSVR